MEILIAVLLIVGGVAFGVYQYRRSGAKLLESQYMQTSSIKDAADIVDSMTSADPNYRHYVELKGSLVCASPLKSPFAERPAAYYSNRCLSVSEQTSTYRDNDGHSHTRTTKQENEISSEQQSAEAYLKDNSCDIPVFINFDSFGGDLDLMECCDRFEPSGSAWCSSFGVRFSGMGFGGGRFLGYRLIERIFPANGSVYVLGELLRMGDRYVVEKAHLAKKPSILSYKSEDQIVQDNKKDQIMSLVIGGGMVLVGIVMLVMHFT